MASKKRLIAFDMAECLDSPEAIAEYLRQVLADGDTGELLRALDHIAEARARTPVEKDAGRGPERG